MRPGRRRELANQIGEWFGVSVRRACRLAGVRGSTFYYQRRAKDWTALKIRLKELALARIRFGYLRLTVLLRREGGAVGKKLVYGCIGGLPMRCKHRRRMASPTRGACALSMTGVKVAA